MTLTISLQEYSEDVSLDKIDSHLTWEHILKRSIKVLVSLCSGLELSDSLETSRLPLLLSTMLHSFASFMRQLI
jgi:hypothetical protein